MTNHSGGENQRERSTSSLTQARENAGETRKYLIFSLNDERYSMPLSKVKEVIRMPQISPLPQVPRFFKGLINLRGQIISVIDLRLKLAMAEGEYDAKRTSIIITEAQDLIIGAIVDDVTEVHGFEERNIEYQLDIPAHIRRDYVSGVARDPDGKLILILDVDKIVSPDELRQMQARAA